MANEFNRDTQPFDEVHMGVGGNVELVQGEGHFIALRVVRGKAEHLDIGVQNNQLQIKWNQEHCRSFWRRWKNSCRVLTVEGRIMSEAITQIRVSGNGNLFSKAMKIENLGLKVQGSGDISLDGVEGEEITTTIQGSGDVLLKNVHLANVSSKIRGSGNIDIESGTSKTSRVSITGSGDYHGSGLRTHSSEVDIKGSGDVVVHATEVLDISIKGSGDVRYEGQPKISTDIKGSGDVSSL